MFYESFANIVLFLSIRWRWSRDIILTVFLPIPVSRARPLQSIAPRCVDIMLAPVELRPQCRRNCKINVKLSRKIQLSITESAAEFGFDLFGEILYQAFAVLGASLTALLFLDYASTYLPVHLDSAEINRADSICPCGFDYRAYFTY